MSCFWWHFIEGVSINGGANWWKKFNLWNSKIFKNGPIWFAMPIIVWHPFCLFVFRDTSEGPWEQINYDLFWKRNVSWCFVVCLYFCIWILAALRLFMKHWCLFVHAVSFSNKGHSTSQSISSSIYTCHSFIFLNTPWLSNPLYEDQHKNLFWNVVIFWGVKE